MLTDPFDKDCPSRQLLDRIGDQWTVLIVLVLGTLLAVGTKLSATFTSLSTTLK